MAAKDERGSECRCTGDGAGANGRGSQDAECAEGAQNNEGTLAAPGADPRHQHDAEGQRAQNGAAGIGCIDTTDKARGIAIGRGRGGQREGETGAPEDGGGQHRPEGADQVDLEGEPGTGGEQRVDGPVGHGLAEHPGGPGDGGHQQKLAVTQGVARLDGAQEQRPGAAAEAQTDEEHGQDDGEGVDGSAEQQPENARPDDLGAQRRGAGKGDREIDGRITMSGFGRRGRRRGDGGARRGASGNGKADERHRQVERRRGERGDGHIELAQQVKARQQAAENRAGGVGTVEQAHPRNAPRAGFEPPRGGGQGGAHKEGRRQQAGAADQGAKQDGGQAVSNRGSIDAVEQGHTEQHQHSAQGDREFHGGIHAQGMRGARGEDARQREAAQAQASHESGQQHA